MTVSQSTDHVANHIALNSNFCPVLAAGLSGCFSELPRDVCTLISCDPDDFHKLQVPDDVSHVKELADFYQALLVRTLPSLYKQTLTIDLYSSATQ